MSKPMDVILGRNGKYSRLTPDYYKSRNPERRSSTRFLTIFRVGRISSQRDSGLCRVQNISDDGMMLTTDLVLTIDDQVLIALSDTVSLAARVMWRVSDRAGIRFEQPIDAGALLQFLATEHRSGSQRPPRLPTDTIGVAQTERGTRIVRVVNISQHGMGIAHDGSFEEGQSLKIMLENGIARRAVVRWSHDNMAGLMLLDPIPYNELGSARKL